MPPSETASPAESESPAEAEASPAASPVAPAAATPPPAALNNGPIATGSKAVANGERAMIKMKDGSSLEADAAWEDAQGFWFRRGGVVSFVDQKQSRGNRRTAAETSSRRGDEDAVETGFTRFILQLISRSCDAIVLQLCTFARSDHKS